MGSRPTATGTAAAGVTAWVTCGRTLRPALRRAPAKDCAATADGSPTKPSPEDGRASSTHSEVIGETTPWGTYVEGQAGLTAGPENSESS